MTSEPENYTYAKGSASTSLHAAVDALAFYSDILPLVPTKPGSIVIDFGGGIGRDALAFFDRAGGDIRAVNIDPDPAMLKKSQELYPGRFALPDENPDPARPVFIQDTLPALANLRKIAPDLKADFALCNAVLMFIEPEQREASLAAMADYLAPGGSLVVRFRTVDLKPGMHPITEQEIDGISAKIAFAQALTVTTAAPAADPQSRIAPDGQPYLWHQRIFTRAP